VIDAEVRDPVAAAHAVSPKTAKRMIIRMTTMVEHYPLSSCEGDERHRSEEGDVPTMAAVGRLIVTLAAEVVGYARLIRADGKRALEQLEAHRNQFLYPKIAEHSGRIIEATGDNLLAEFESPNEAVRCAVELQIGMVDRNIRVLPDRRITFRIGVTIDRVTGNGDDLVSRAVAALPRGTLATLIKPGAGLYGEGGNIAVRLAALAEPAGICISGAVRDAIRDQLPYTFKDIGKQNLELRAAPVHCYAVNADAAASGPRLAAQKPQRRPMRLRGAAVAVGVFGAVGVCGVVLLAWLATNSSTALIHARVTAGSQVSPVSVTADGAALASSSRQSPLVSSPAADTDTLAPPASQTPPASGTVADRSIQAPSSRLALSETGAVVVRGKEAPSALQTTPDNGTAALGGMQAPAVLLTTPNSGAAVVRGKQEASALQITPDGGATVVRGNQAPSAPEVAPDGAADVVRGTRVFSRAPLSPRPDQR
jgi:class 3 adenylate cyclase